MSQLQALYNIQPARPVISVQLPDKHDITQTCEGVATSLGSYQRRHTTRLSHRERAVRYVCICKCVLVGCCMLMRNQNIIRGGFCWVVISLAHKFTNRALYGYPIPPYCDEETLLNCENISHWSISTKDTNHNVVHHTVHIKTPWRNW